MVSTPRIALLVGGTGLVGRALLSMLLASKHYQRVHVLLRRTSPDIKASAKLRIHQVDFAQLPPELPRADDVFITLGTTIKIAGSQAAFRQVDFDFVVNTARAARAAGATRLAVVSALGADAKSRVFYSRVKGEMQEAIAQLGYETVVIAQPSMLLGDRRPWDNRLGVANYGRHDCSDRSGASCPRGCGRSLPAPLQPHCSRPCSTQSKGFKS